MNTIDKQYDYLKSQGDIHKYDDVKSVKMWGEHPHNPFFSIYIPTYKRLELLKQSLLCAMNQKEITDYEIVIVDNDSDFGETEILNYIKSLDCPRIIYYKNEKNIGIYGNTLRGATLSHGKYVSLLNDDDLLHPYYLYVMKGFITKIGYYGVIGSVPQDFRDNDFKFPHLPRGVFGYKVNNREFFFGCSVTSPGLLYPREILEDIYNAYEELLMGDQIIQYKGLVKYGLYFICFPIAAYRIQNNATLKDNVLEQMMMHMCKFRKQTAKDDLLLNLFMLFFYKEYCNWYISSSVDFWKKKSMKKKILKSVGVDQNIENSLKSMLTRTIIHFVHVHYGKMRGTNHDTLKVPSKIMVKSKQFINRDDVIIKNKNEE